jgi:hypothetical protein
MGNFSDADVADSRLAIAQMLALARTTVLRALFCADRGQMSRPAI